MSVTNRNLPNLYEFPGGNGRWITVRTNLFDMKIDISRSIRQFEVIASRLDKSGNRKPVQNRKVFELFKNFYGQDLCDYELVEGYPTQYGIIIYTSPSYPYNNLLEKHGVFKDEEIFISGEFRGNVKTDDWQNFDNELKRFLKRAALQCIAKMFVKHDFTLMQKSIYTFKTQDTRIPAKPLNNVFQLISGFNLGFETTVPKEHNNNQSLSRNMVSINLTQTVVTRTNISLIDCYLELCSITYQEEVATPDELRGNLLEQEYVKMLNNVFRNIEVYIAGEEDNILYKFGEICNRRPSRALVQSYEEKLRMRLRFPSLNVVQLKFRKDRTLPVPMELVILSDRPQKIATAAISIMTELNQKLRNLKAIVPQKRWEFIESIAGMLHAELRNENENNLLKSVGIKINDIPIDVDAHVLDEPWDTYSTNPGNLAMPYKNPIEYVIIDLCTFGNHEDAIRRDVRNLMDKLYQLGISISNVRPLEYFAHVSSNPFSNFLADIIQWHDTVAAYKTNNKILYLVIIDQSTFHYASVKKEFDAKGLTNQCITPNVLQSIQPSYRQDTTNEPKESVIFNIALKINAKLGGVNCLPMTNDPLNLWKEYINDKKLMMFIGIDTRLADQKRKLGLVGITASIDNTGSRYNAFAVMTDGIQKYCSNYKRILYQALDSYEGTTGQPGQFPNNIMIFRAGLNEYEAVKGEGVLEIKHIQNVIEQYMHEKNCLHKPNITYISYNRAHNVRFYDLSKESTTQRLQSDNDVEGCKWNCSPGTVIDSQITNPNCFYLISHETCLGTTKPAKYIIVVDEVKFKADNLLAIVYQLCRLMSQTSRPFRRPVPIGLASKLLKRCVDVEPKIFNNYRQNQPFIIHHDFRDKPFYL